MQPQAAVSTQNVFPRLHQRAAIVVIGAGAAVIAAFVTLGSYEAFLFLLGSVFIPLFAVLLADWAAISNRPGITYDSIHLNPDGARLMTNLVRTTLGI